MRSPYPPKRLVAEEQWDIDMIKGLKGLPRQPVPERAGNRIPIWIDEAGDGISENDVDKEPALSEEVMFEDEPETQRQREIWEQKFRKKKMKKRRMGM